MCLVVGLSVWDAVWGRVWAGVCFVSRIAVGFCEWVAGSRGAQRPRSGAVGALEAAGREQMIAGGRDIKHRVS